MDNSDKEKQNNLVSLTSKSGYDQNLYGDDLGDKESFVSSKFVKSISVLEEDEEDETAGGTHPSTKRMTSQVQEETDLELLRRYQDQNTSGIDHRTIGEKQDAYHRQAQNMQLSPERGDMFSENNEGRSYADVLKQHQLEKEKNEVIRQGEEIIKQQNIDSLKRQRSTMEENNKSWDSEEKPNVTEAQTPVNSSWDATPVQENKKRKISRWDTPLSSSDSMTIGDTPSRKTRWDETPMNGSGPLSLTIDLTPLLATDGSKALNMPITAEMASRVRYEHEIQARNRPLTDEELETLFPPGYKIIKPPENYKATYNPSKSLLVTPTPGGSTPSFFMQTPNSTISNLEIGGSIAQNTGVLEAELPPLKPEDVNFFGKLFTEGDESKMTADEARERKILTLLLKIKNGTPQQRKGALRQISDKARELGPEHIFMNMLPILKSQTLEEQERHLLVKTLDRVLYKLDDLVRPYAHKILVVIEPLLIDEDYYARTEGKEIISNLAKAAGLATMVSIMRPDIDKDDEFVRNVTSRAFAVVASALGVPTLLPFLKAVCTSKKSWQARQTGIRIVQHIAINMGCAVLPHLKDLVLIVEPGLNDEQQRVRTMSALSLSALAEASYPYGIEAFDPVLQPLWKNCRKLRGKSLAAILKAIGFIIPLMAPEYASHYTKDVTPILIREFQTPDEEMKKTVLKVIQQCVSTDGVTAAYCKEYILPEYFSNFWVRRMALDRRNYTQCVETTIELANKVGVGNILVRLVENLKDESEPFRKMVLETVHKIVLRKGVSDLDANLESKLMDGFFFCFQEQSGEDSETMLNAFGAIATALGVRMKAYIVQINSIIKWRFQNKIAKVRMLAADMITKIAAVYTKCDEEKSLLFLSNIMYENLGEEYPEVLGSILGALKSIVNVVGMQNMRPPIKDLLPKLTPILRNRHEKVQENCIDLVGRIADRGADQVSPREWMRICFDLLEVIKAHKKSIRRAANNTFGYIAKAIGPQDVLQALLANLKVQERQLRLCTTIAIAIIAETCQPFTVLPALMNEYRQPDHNVQNGVLKTLSFMFEYIAEMCQDYIYAITPLLEDALIDRDIIHRQTASSAVGYLAVGVFGLGKEDALVHLLNQVFPNLFETSPHVIKAVFFAMESIRLSIGVGRFLAYVYQGLFHAARKVREPYWKLYNNCYVYCADSMTPYYPRFSDEVGMENYERSYLELNI